jgi:hypothetical protein
MGHHLLLGCDISIQALFMFEVSQRGICSHRHCTIQLTTMGITFQTWMFHTHHWLGYNVYWWYMLNRDLGMWWNSWQVWRSNLKMCLNCFCFDTEAPCPFNRLEWSSSQLNPKCHLDVHHLCHNQIHLIFGKIWIPCHCCVHFQHVFLHLCI